MRIFKAQIVLFISVMAILFAPRIANARANTLLQDGWKFHLGDVSNAASVSFDDRKWQDVSLPHCWGWQEAQQGKKFYRGPGWYRCELVAKPESGKRYFLRFEAASTVADVYLNGNSLEEHRGGFGAFCFEITTNLSAARTNQLAVKVSNAPEPDIAPLSGDFNVYGGLYRPVHLIEVNQECFALTDHASPGVAWLQTEVSPEQAVLNVTAQISNGSHHWQTLTLATKVLSAEGEVVTETNETIRLAPETTAPYWSRVAVENPHLWNGRQNPYLYRAVVELRSTNQLVDSVEQPMGLRFYRIDPDKGFSLNGKHYPIYGVCRHQDRFNKGWAISDADMEQNVSLIKEIGATAVRCAHYEHSDYFYSLCDRAGILVWAEIPQVNDIEDTAAFEATCRNQLLDLIRQNLNHPSIFVWSLFNEVGNGHTDDPHRELQDLNNLAHSEDPTRPTIAATCTSKFPQMNKIPDLLGWNIYPGWYGGKDSLAKFGTWLDAHRYDSRNGGFCISEYGAGANIRQHEDAPQQPKTSGQWHPEEWQAIVHEQDWVVIKSHPFVWGSFVWNMFDFCVTGRHEGGKLGLNDKGLVAFDRKTKKDAFYFYQANWSDAPVLHITSQRFAERTNAVTDIKVYSNAATVELLMNGVSQGARTNDGNAVFVWKDSHLIPGEDHIEARAERSGVALKDDCIWKLLK